MDELAQLLVLILLIVLATVAITQGPAGLKQWWNSKFLGHTP